jgi:hypothetical protein
MTPRDLEGSAVVLINHAGEVRATAPRASLPTLVAFIRSEPGMAERLLAEHADDGSGRCRVRVRRAQSGRYQFPCAIARAATDAGTPGWAGGGIVIGGGR